MNIKTTFAISTLVLALTACGGSDSDDAGITDPVTEPTVNSTPITLSSTNMEEASSVSINSSFNNVALETTDGFTGVVVEQPSANFHVTDSEWLKLQLQKLPSINDTFTGIAITETEDCLVSGDMSFTFDFQDEAVFSANDTITYTANNCDDGYGVTSGEFTLKITQADDFVDYDDYTTLGINVTFTNYSVSFSTESISFYGSYSIVINKDLYTETSDITSDQLTIHIPSYQTTVENLIAQQVYTLNTGIETYTTSSKVSDDILGGSVTVSTIEEFVFSSRYTDTPSSGVMKITGANGGTVLLTVIGGSVQLDADFDGNGVIDNTVTTTWYDLTY